MSISIHEALGPFLVRPQLSLVECVVQFDWHSSPTLQFRRLSNNTLDYQKEMGIVGML
jgi:hypothetical protein